MPSMFSSALPQTARVMGLFNCSDDGSNFKLRSLFLHGQKPHRLEVSNVVQCSWCTHWFIVGILFTQRKVTPKSYGKVVCQNDPTWSIDGQFNCPNCEKNAQNPKIKHATEIQK